MSGLLPVAPETGVRGGAAPAAGPAAGRYFVATLGCKLNRFDSAWAEGILRAGRYEATDDPARADVILLNTCTVTARADADGRKLARRFRRQNPHARIVATGCYAEREPEALRALGVLDDVVGLSDRERLPEALLGHSECVTGPLWLHFGDRARAFLRVQEGCDLACSYCIIPSVRGPGRSLPESEIEQEVRRLAIAGVREIGLTGVNTGSWGRDLEPRRPLAALLERLLGLDLPLRFRLNSLEPRTVTDEIVALMAAAPDRLVPHVQIPLQSGCDAVLARMSRNYRTGLYRRVVESVAERVPDACIGADVITGFPGETDAEFDATRRFIDSLPLGYLHVFSYSVRPGTRAADFDGHVPPATIRARTAALRDLSAAKERAFRERLLGRTLEALVLSEPAKDGSARALTGNYVEALVPASSGAAAGRLLPVTLDEIDEGGIVRGSVAA